MKYRSTFLISFTIGICLGLFVILYMRYLHFDYGSDLILKRIIPIGVALISVIAGALCAMSYKKGPVIIPLTPPIYIAFRMLFSRGTLIPPLFFPFGVLLSNIILSINHSKPIDLGFFLMILTLFFILYIFGIIGAFLGKMFFFDTN